MTGETEIAGPSERHGNRNSCACTVCGDTEPSHVHHEGRRIEGYFTVGRGETDFEAAQRWRHAADEAQATVTRARVHIEAMRQAAYSGMLIGSGMNELDALRTVFERGAEALGDLPATHQEDEMSDYEKRLEAEAEVTRLTKRVGELEGALRVIAEWNGAVNNVGFRGSRLQAVARAALATQNQEGTR